MSENERHITRHEQAQNDYWATLRTLALIQVYRMTNDPNGVAHSTDISLANPILSRMQDSKALFDDEREEALNNAFVTFLDEFAASQEPRTKPASTSWQARVDAVKALYHFGDVTGGNAMRYGGPAARPNINHNQVDRTLHAIAGYTYHEGKEAWENLAGLFGLTADLYRKPQA